MDNSGRLLPTGRGPGRPVGANSAETRARILRAASEVISERGYEAANFQIISQRAGLSRPTMHYYFHTREQIYESLLREAHSVVADCIAEARLKNTLLKQLSTFVAAARRLDFAEGSMLRFIITSRLESHRHPRLRACSTPVVDAVGEFYESMVADAVRRGEIPDDIDATAVVNMLASMFWGMGFFAGFVHKTDEVKGIAKQLQRFLVSGLLDGPVSSRSLTIAPDAPATVPTVVAAWPSAGLDGRRETPDSSRAIRQ